MFAFGSWRSPWQRGHARLTHINRALTVVRAAADPEQAYVRKCATEIGLIRDQIAMPAVRRGGVRARPATVKQLAAIHAQVNPTRACYQLAKLVTGLADNFAWRITADQITDRAVLGCPVPESARPIVRALEVDDAAVLGGAAVFDESLTSARISADIQAGIHISGGSDRFRLSGLHKPDYRALTERNDRALPGWLQRDRPGGRSRWVLQVARRSARVPFD